MTDTIKPRDISDELVERVARELRSFYSCEPVAVCDGVAFKAARATIAVALEEAAKMAESFTTPPVASDFGTVIVDQGGEIAAAIRSLMKENPNA